MIPHFENLPHVMSALSALILNTTHKFNKKINQGYDKIIISSFTVHHLKQQQIVMQCPNFFGLRNFHNRLNFIVHYFLKIIKQKKSFAFEIL